MKPNDKDMPEKSGKSTITIVLYIAASVVALIGIALLIDNIYIFKTTIDQYVAQGYPAADVKKSLIPSQLLPGIFEPIAVYGGIAFILIGLGSCIKKMGYSLVTQIEAENHNDLAEEGIMNPGQNQFYNFILERVEEDKKEEAKTLLEESFIKQNEDTFDKEYLSQWAPKILEMVKPEYKTEVKNIMEGFAANY